METPLHVRVAEALGWKKPSEQTPPRCNCCGWPLVDQGEPGCWTSSCSMRPVPPRRADEAPRYDTDWNITGQLIEKFGLVVAPFSDYWMCLAVEPRRQEPRIMDPIDAQGLGETPLQAACLCILEIVHGRKG